MLNFYPRLVQNQFFCIRVVVTFLSEFITSRTVIYISTVEDILCQNAEEYIENYTNSNKLTYFTILKIKLNLSTILRTSHYINIKKEGICHNYDKQITEWRKWVKF
mgnify:CR=1 FL=1